MLARIRSQLVRTDATNFLQPWQQDKQREACLGLRVNPSGADKPITGSSLDCGVQDEIKDQLGNEETQAEILLDLGRPSQAEEVYRYTACYSSALAVAHALLAQ